MCNVCVFKREDKNQTNQFKIRKKKEKARKEQKVEKNRKERIDTKKWLLIFFAAIIGFIRVCLYRKCVSAQRPTYTQSLLRRN